MDKRTLDSRLAKQEGKKSQTAIGNIREITAAITDMAAAEALQSGETEVSKTEVIGTLIHEANKKLGRLRRKAKLV